jgi:HSP20 family molecular chaperone IbpA
MKYNLYQKTNDFDRIFNSVFGGLACYPDRTSTEKYYDIEDGEDHYFIVVPIAGVKKENINVSLDNRTLNVDCESELNFGIRKFSNKFRVLPGTTEEHMSASYEDGVLRVRVEKVRQDSQIRQIPIL